MKKFNQFIDENKEVVNEARIMSVKGNGKKYRIADLTNQQKVYFGRDEYIVMGIKQEQVVILKGRKGEKVLNKKAFEDALKSREITNVDVGTVGQD